MRVRCKKSGALGHASSFNIHAPAEVFVGFDEGDADSISVADLEVKLKAGWKDMDAALRDHDLITDNYNSYFFEPQTPAERERGYRLDSEPLATAA